MTVKEYSQKFPVLVSITEIRRIILVLILITQTLTYQIQKATKQLISSKFLPYMIPGWKLYHQLKANPSAHRSTIMLIWVVRRLVKLEIKPSAA